MAKLTLSSINSDYASRTTLNTNFDRIETAMEKTLSRDGTSPNFMTSNLDMNSRRIINLPAPTSASEPARLQDLVPGTNFNVFSIDNYVATISEAKTLFGVLDNIANGLPVFVAGRTSNNDGYQGVFIYDSSDVITTFAQDALGFVDNQGRRFFRQYLGPVWLEWFGAIGNGTTECDTAIATVATEFPSGCTLAIGFGDFKFVSPFMWNGSDFRIYGLGPNKTKLIFAPSTHGTFFQFGDGVGPYYRNGLSSVTLYTDNATFTMTALDLQDQAEFRYNDVRIAGSINDSGTSIWGARAAAGIGLRIRAREFVRMSGIDISAPKPMVISPLVGTSGIDHCYFRDSYLIAAGNPCVTIETGNSINNSVVFDGYAFVRGTYGFYNVDTTAAASGILVELRNGNWEQREAIGSGTITITIASPGVVTWANHGFSTGATIKFTTTGALPTGLTAGKTYFVSSDSLGASTFRLAPTSADADAGTNSINTSGIQSGVHTGTVVGWGVYINRTAQNLQQINIENMDFDPNANGIFMRGISQAQIETCVYPDTGGVFIDVNSTSKPIILLGNYLLSGSMVHTGTLKKTFSVGQSSLGGPAGVLEVWDSADTSTLILESYAKASLPDASTVGKFIFVTDETGGSIPAFADGTNYRRVTDRAIVS